MSDDVQAFLRHPVFLGISALMYVDERSGYCSRHNLSTYIRVVNVAITWMCNADSVRKTSLKLCRIGK